MITEGLLSGVFKIIETFFSLFPQITITAESNPLTLFMNLISCVLYLFPVDTVFAIVSLIIDFLIIKVIIALLKTLWGILPLV